MSRCDGSKEVCRQIQTNTGAAKARAPKLSLSASSRFTTLPDPICSWIRRASGDRFSTCPNAYDETKDECTIGASTRSLPSRGDKGRHFYHLRRFTLRPDGVHDLSPFLPYSTLSALPCVENMAPPSYNQLSTSCACSRLFPAHAPIDSDDWLW